MKHHDLKNDEGNFQQFCYFSFSEPPGHNKTLKEG